MDSLPKCNGYNGKGTKKSLDAKPKNHRKLVKFLIEPKPSMVLFVGIASNFEPRNY